MPDKDDKNWAGEGFSRLNEESAKPKPEPKDDDEEGWIWE